MKGENQQQLLDSIAGFKILPVTFQPAKYVKTDFQSLTTSMTSNFSTTRASSSPKNEQNQVQEASAEHYIYFKKNEAKNDHKLPKGKTLFLANIPVSTNENHLRRLFRHTGTIENIIWGKKSTASGMNSMNYVLGIQHHNEDSLEELAESAMRFDPDVHHFVGKFSWTPFSSGAMCHVVFKESESIDRCMNMKRRKRVWSDSLEDDQLLELEKQDNVPRVYGKTKFTLANELQEQDLVHLQEKVDKYLQEFKETQEEKKRELLANRNQPDEDGFVTVTRARGRRNTNSDRVGAVVTAANPHEMQYLIEKKTNKKTELKNFYRFQIRETKRQELADLRAKFEDDKQKIEKLKSQRRFKPY